MMNNIILNGVNSNTIQGLIIQELSPISKPAIRTEIEEIDGRDGDVTTRLGYAAYDKQLSIGLYRDFDINEVIAFFNTSGVVTFSNEPDKYYNYQILNQIDFERLVRFRTATVTMHVQPFKYSTTETEEELSGTVITAEGTNINLINTEENGLFTDLEIKGATEQDSYSGKNLFNTNNLSTNTLSGLTTALKDAKLTFNGNNSSMGYIIPHNSNTGITLPAGTYTLSMKILSGTTNVLDTAFTAAFYIKNYNTNTEISNVGVRNAYYNSSKVQSKQFTLSEETQIGCEMYTNGSVTYNNLEVGIQIESGSTYTEWEKYVGGAVSPNPGYPQEVKTVTGDNTITICGKNLFDKDNANILNGILSDGGKFVSNDYSRTLYIPCKNDTYYTIQKIQSTYFRVAEFLNIPTNGASYINRIKNDGSAEPVTIKTTTGNYLAVNYYINTDTLTEQQILDSIQIEQGSTATDYEAYQGQTYPISLGNIELCEINGVEDYIYKNNGTWYLHKETGKDDIKNNISDINYNSILSDEIQFITPIISNTVATLPNVLSTTNCFSNITNKFYGTTSSNHIRFLVALSILGTTSSSTPNQHKTALINLLNQLDEVLFYYPLATPTDTEITDSTLLSQLNALGNATTYLGETNIIVSGEVLTPTLYVETLSIDDPVLRVTNSGNTTAKPIITLYGVGIINLYLNGEQIFVVDLSNENSITIDVTNMEAYYNGILKNRLVTGNYENFILNQGENEITFTGSLYSMKISNYSRWI